MSRHLPLILVAAIAMPTAGMAQHAGAGAAVPPAAVAPQEANQFDFLVGEWRLTVEPRVSGLAARIHGVPKLVGSWKAWRAFDGWGIEDEMRILDASGNPVALTHVLRAWDPAAKHWIITMLDVYRARFSSSAAEWHDGAMTLSGSGTDAEGKPYIGRTRFFDITPTRFRYQIDRSYDNGKSWTTGVTKIEATRVAAAAPR
jgi:hypothetical protein